MFEIGLEPTTFSFSGWRSTTELFELFKKIEKIYRKTKIKKRIQIDINFLKNDHKSKFKKKGKVPKSSLTK